MHVFGGSVFVLSVSVIGLDKAVKEQPTYAAGSYVRRISRNSELLIGGITAFLYALHFRWLGMSANSFFFPFFYLIQSISKHQLHYICRHPPIYPL